MNFQPFDENPIDKETGLTLNNYKEPLRKVSDGFGYLGALLCTPDGEKVQCHVCGGMFYSLGNHISQAHMPVDDYREKFQISRLTALVSELTRNKMKEASSVYWKSLSASQRKSIRQHAIKGLQTWRNLNSDKIKNIRWKIRLETKNKRGTCPDQLLEKIREVKEKMGRTPSLAEFITETNGQRYKHLIFSTFGSWTQALRLLGLQPKPNNPGKNMPPHRHTKEQLLESLSVFAQEFRKVPTATDCKRGLIYSYETYQRRFGTFEKARRLAGVYDFV